MFCTNCGHQIDGPSKFCPYCGTKLDIAEEILQQNAPQDTPEPVPVQPEPVPVQPEIPAVEAAEAAAQEIRGEVPEDIPTPESPAVEPQPAPAYTQPQPAPVYTQAPPVPGETEPKKKSKKGLIIGLVVGGVVLIGVIVAALLILLPILTKQKKITIDMMQYASVEFTGYNGKGVSEAKFDTEKFIADYGEQIQYMREYKDYGDDPVADVQEMLFYYTEGDDYYLSNGDKVKYELFVGGIEEIFNIDIEGYDEAEAEAANSYLIEKDFTVAGLEDVPEIDPFEGIEIVVTGRDHHGELEISTENCPAPMNELGFAIDADEYWDLSNGDVITLTLSDIYDDDYLLQMYDIKPTRRTMEYTVEGLSTMITSTDQINDAAGQDLEAACMDIFEEEFESLNASNQHTDNYYIVGSILKYPKDLASYDSNSLYVVYRQDSTVSDDDGTGQAFTTYSVIRFDDLYVNGDEVEIDLEDYSVIAHEFSITRGVWTMSGHYAFETLDEIKDYIVDETSTVYDYEVDFAE